MIVALLFAATVINYIDRQMIGVLKPTLMQDLHWSERDFAGVIIWFQIAYAIGYIGFGKFVDMVGARVGYAVAFVIWQLAHIAHGGAYSMTQFAMARFGLGIGESGNFPAGIKAVTEWFPAKERAFAIGVFNAGANIGAVITPLVVPLMVIAWGWRMAFVVTGVISFVWLIAWWAMYRSPREHKKVTEGELAWIEQDPADPGQADRLWHRADPQGDLGLFAGQVLHRPDLVVLPLLAAGLSVQAVRPQPADLRHPARGDLPDLRRRQRVRRLDVVEADEGGQVGELRAQGDDVRLRLSRPAGGVRRIDHQRLGRRAGDRRRDPRATRPSRPISTRSPPICSRAARSDRSWALAARSVRSAVS
jgi:hypothetical protein